MFVSIFPVGSIKYTVYMYYVFTKYPFQLNFVIFPNQYFYFFADFDWSLGKIKWFLYFDKTYANEYLISALIG